MKATSLPLNKTAGPLSLARRGKFLEAKMTLDAPALWIMTDFIALPAFSIGPDIQIDHALLYMKAAGVSFLFVLDDENGLGGFVTSNDIQGEKPMRHMQSVDCTHATCSRSEVLVKHIMTPVSQWEVIEYGHVERAKISQVIATFEKVGRRHLVVTERKAVRGILTASRVEQATGTKLEIVSSAKNFSEIEHVLIHSH